MQQENISNTLDIIKFVSKVFGVYPIIKSQGQSYWIQVAYTCFIQISIAVLVMVHCINQNQELFYVDEESDPDINNRMMTISCVHLLNYVTTSCCFIPLLYFALYQGETFGGILRRLEAVAVNLECSTEIVLQVRRHAGTYSYVCNTIQVFFIWVEPILWDNPFTLEGFFLHVFPIFACTIAFSAFECQWIYLLTIKRCLFSCLNKKIQQMRDSMSVTSENIEMFRKCHADLCDLASPLVRIFQPTLLLAVPLLQLNILTCLYWTMVGIWDHLRETSHVDAYVITIDGVFWSSIYFVRLVYITAAAHATQEEAVQTLNDLQKLEFDENYSEVFEEVQLMREQLQQNCRAYKFPVFGLFCIDRGFLWTACGSVVAYFLTVLQFHLLKTQLQ